MKLSMRGKTVIGITIALFALPASAMAWVAPIGVPAPSWPGGGIDQARPALPAGWSSEQLGWYYISASGCSDSRTYGYPGAARCSVPSAPAAGSKIVLDGTISGDRQ